MRTLEVLAPETLEEALALKAHHGTALLPLAGGTDVIPGIRRGAYGAVALLDLSRIPDLNRIVDDGTEIRIGALATHADVVESAIVGAHIPVLSEACGTVGSVQIRSRGTIGGNLCHASPASDSVPALRVLGSVCEIRSSKGTREIPVGDFCISPGVTRVLPADLLVGIRVPKMRPGSRWFYLKLGQRRAMAIAKVSVAFLAAEDGGVLSDVRISLGAVAPTVCGAPRTAACLEGKKLGETVISEAVEMIQTEAKPIADIRSTEEYRREMVGVLLGRGLRGFLE
ncbi:MAG: xanthine dehydrogenase family protein subunit M [Candidatus Eisenbacteria sp.]|nr:xanthine dehydrogenase family protein subunit M [Candidatus Eisenbacteria bacterium]